MRRLAEGPGLAYTYVPGREMADGTDGLAIVSAYPIADVAKMARPRTRGRQRIAIAADLVVGTHTIRVINLHLEVLLNAAQRIEQLHPVIIDAPDVVLVGGDFNTGWAQWVNGEPILRATS